MFDLSRIGRVLTFFAHPDDETLAAGATMDKLSKLGVEIFVAIPATGMYSRINKFSKQELDKEYKKLRGNCYSALKILGVPKENIFLGNFSDNQLDKHPRLELIQWLEEIISRVKPEVIFTHHSFCTNIDHRYCHEAAIVATRPNVNCHIQIISGEIPAVTGYLRPAQWEPNLYFEISPENLERKVSALKAYETEVRKDPDPRSPEVIRALSKVRGSESGFNLAEGFMINRLLTK